jgi:hypothetical protein
VVGLPGSRFSRILSLLLSLLLLSCLIPIELGGLDGDGSPAALEDPLYEPEGPDDASDPIPPDDGLGITPDGVPDAGGLGVASDLADGDDGGGMLPSLPDWTIDDTPAGDDVLLPAANPDGPADVGEGDGPIAPLSEDACISGMLWADGDGTEPTDWDGLFNNPGREHPLGGYTVYLYDAADPATWVDVVVGDDPVNDIELALDPAAYIDMSVTDVDGLYEFIGVLAGDYILGLQSMFVDDQEYLLPITQAPTADNAFIISWDSRPYMALTDALTYDGISPIDGIDGSLRIPEPIDMTGVGDWYGPYQPLYAMTTGNAPSKTYISSSMNNRVWLMTGGWGNEIEFDAGVSGVIVMAGTSRNTADSSIVINSGCNVTIYLHAGTTNTMNPMTAAVTGTNAGIYVKLGGTLTIEGPGTLTSTGRPGGAGIGGTGWTRGASQNDMPVDDCGTIIIDATGTINAYGGNDAAGIGGGQNCANGTVIIERGTVNADGSRSGGAGAAGIGGGGGRQGCNPGGKIVINGGTINATSRGSSAAIGGGFNSNGGSLLGGSGAQPGGGITITGGFITATSLAAGAGIGGGGGHKCGDILITGGTITAQSSNNAAGIGSGQGASASGGKITITGGIINAKSLAGSASGIGGGAGAVTEINITGGNVLSLNPDGYIRINEDPRNWHPASDPGSQLVYCVEVLVLRSNGNPVDNAEVSIVVDNILPSTYVYTATTDAAGKCYMWLPADTFGFLFYDRGTGYYVDGMFTVYPQGNQYLPGANNTTWRIRAGEPAWSVSVIDNNIKTYGTAILDVNIDHNNIRTGSTDYRDILRVRWYREPIQDLHNTWEDFQAGLWAAEPNGNGGWGGSGEALELLGGATQHVRRYQMPLDRNGRYWVEIHYKGANTGRDVVHVAYVDVRNVFTPVSVNVRGYIPGSSGGGLDVNVHPYIPQTQKVGASGNLLPGPIGIPLDADGSLMVDLTPGYYDRVRYYRPNNLPPAWWDMQPSGYPFDLSTQLNALYSDMELGVIVLGSNTIEYTNHFVFDVTDGSTPTNLFYRVEYQPQNMSVVTAYYVNPAGQPITIGGSSTAQFMVPLNIGDNAYQSTNFLANGGIFIPSTAADPVLARGYYVRPPNPSTGNNGYPVSDITQGSNQNTFYALTDFTQFNPTLVYGTQQNAGQGILANGNRLFIVFSEPPPTDVDFTFYKVDRAGATLSGVRFSLYRCTNANPATHSHDWLARSGSCWGNPTLAVSDMGGKVEFAAVTP